MINRAWTPFGLLMLVYLLVLLPAGAQVIDYGKSLPKDPAATEDFGIVSYNLSQDGEVYFIELLGAKGPLALCEVTMEEDQGFTLQEATCEVIGKGHFRTRIGKNFAEFEDLITGEYSRLHFERVSRDELGVETLAPGETLEVGETAIANGFRMRIESPLSAEEIERRWSHISGLVGHALAEVAYTFGFLEKIAREQSEEIWELWYKDEKSPESREKKSIESYEKESIENQGNFDLCPEGQQKVCMVGSFGGFYASFFGGSAGSCCSVASNSANNLCFQYTGRGCCANRLCVAEGSFPLVRCGVDGIPWTCSPHC